MFDPWSYGLATNKTPASSTWTDPEAAYGAATAPDRKAALSGTDDTFAQLQQISTSDDNIWLNMADEFDGSSCFGPGMSEGASFLSDTAFADDFGDSGAATSLQDLCNGVAEQTSKRLPTTALSTQTFLPSPNSSPASSSWHPTNSASKSGGQKAQQQTQVAAGMKAWQQPRSGRSEPQTPPPPDLKEPQETIATKLQWAAEPNLLPPPSTVPRRTKRGLRSAAADAAPVLAQASSISPHLQKQLCAAINEGNVEDARKLLVEHGADPSACGPGDPLRSPVYLAAMAGHAGILQMLLEHKADPNKVRTDIGASPIYTAAENGHSAAVKVLLAHNADPNKGRTDIGTTPMYIAAACGHSGVVKVLLMHKGAPNKARLSDGCTPLYMAAQNGHFHVVKMLQAHSADPNQVRTDIGAAPMHVAAQNGHTGIVRELLKNNADPNKTTFKTGATPMSMAAYNGHYEVVKVLVEGNANPNQANVADGTTPMYMTAGQGHVGIAQLLLENNADPNMALTSDGTTQVCIAAKNGHIDVVTLLLAYGADADQACSDNGATPVYISAQNGHLEVVKVLLEHNADPNKARTDGGDGKWTPLIMATAQGHTDVAALLVQHHAK